MQQKVPTFLLFVVFLFLSHLVQAQPNKQYYWKGSSGNFNDPSMWWIDGFGSGTTATQAPNSTNSVFFTAAAFSTAGVTVTVATNANCDSLFWDNSISAANLPILAGNSGVSLDIYGSFALADNLDFQYQGMLRFRSQRSGIETLDPRGKMLKILKLEIEGSASTEFRLLSSLHVEDLNNSTSNLLPAQGGFTELLSGTFNTNGQDVFFDFFHSKNNNASRGLILNNSTITIDGYHRETCWKIDFDTLSHNYTTFDATASHLVFSWYHGYDWIEFGKGLDYDSVTLQVAPSRGAVATDVYVYLHMGGSKDCSINHLLLNTRLYFIYTSNRFTIHNLYFKSKRAEFGWHTAGAPHVYLENVFAPNHCDHFYPMRPISNGSNKMTIHKLTPGILTLNNLLLTNVDCDITGGRTYVANNSIDGNRNSANWTINPPASRQLYYRDHSGDNWHTLANWEEKIGASFVPAGCLPTPVDDVYFDASSFSSHTYVRFDTIAYAHHLTFDNNIPAGSEIRFYQSLNMFGNLQGSPTIKLRNTSQGTLFAFGTQDTIQTNGAAIAVNLLLEAKADYTFIGNYNAPAHGIDSRSYYSVLRANSDTLFLAYFYLGETHLDSTQVFLYRSDRWSMYDRGGSKNYAGTATFHFQPSSFSAINIRHMPNVIFYGPVYCAYYDLNIHGDVTFLDNGNLSYSYYGAYSTRSQFQVSGTMPLYNGNMTLTAGKSYTFASAANSFLHVAGDLNALGNCAELISMKTNGYATGVCPIQVSGTANIDFASLQGLDNTGNPPLVTTNSIDAGNNTNITFASNTGSTFYWRALNGTPSDFQGEWTNQGHWTTNPASLVGDSSCIPSLLDSVIFDNLSFSPTSNGCNVTGFASCRSLIFRADAKLTGSGSTNGNRPESPNRIYIAESFMLANNMSNFDYRGSIHMVGSGDIDANGTTLEIYKIEFDKAGGVWNFQNDFIMDNAWAGTNVTYMRYGIFSLKKGTVNTNNHNLAIPAQFVATGSDARTLNLGSSIINHACNGMYYVHWSGQTRFPWDVRTPTNFTLNAGTSQIIFANNPNSTIHSLDKHFYMGSGLNYNQIRFEELVNNNYIHNNTNYGYAEFIGSVHLYDNNTFDSIRLEGGQYYRLGAGNTQTLNAPHGKLITNGNSSSFIFIESTVSGSTAFLRKPYGPAFCIDFVKVKEVEGTKETNMALIPTAPINYQTMQPFLEFQTGVNSDNINGTATGIWGFNLSPIVSPILTGADSIRLCKYSSPQYVPLTMTGTGPYFLDYTWTDINSGSGASSVTVADDDNDPSTPFLYNLALPSNSLEVHYNMSIHTSRCGKITPNVPVDIWTFAQEKDTLVDFATTASCQLDNEPTWFTFMDDIGTEPIVALRDSVNPADNQALGLTNVEVFFEPTTQTVSYMTNNYPYLNRHWRIIPNNNGPARIRLFFTQTELDSLAAHTYWGVNITNPLGTLDPATDIQILKYSSGTIGVGTPTVLPHIVVPMTGNITAPFDDISNVIAVEFEVSSFSHFIIVPTQIVLLPLKLTSFDANVIHKDRVKIDWTASSEATIQYYEVERSKDAINAEAIERVAANGLDNSSYTLTDLAPYKGTSYYRIKAVDFDGDFTYSEWRAVEIEGWNLLKVFPIPTQNQLNIEVNSNLNETVTLEVYNALGRLVLQQNRSIQTANRQNLTLQTSSLASGVYYLRISNNLGYTQQRKFVIQK